MIFLFFSSNNCLIRNDFIIESNSILGSRSENDLESVSFCEDEDSEIVLVFFFDVFFFGDFLIIGFDGFIFFFEVLSSSETRFCG